MKTARYSDAQIMGILKQAEGGVPISELCREHGMSMQNDLLEEALGKERYGRLYDESGHECGHRARYQHRADLEDVSDQRDLLSLQHYSERWERRDY